MSVWCDCEDCVESDPPCAYDCGPESMCKGCREAEAYYDEVVFESRKALGEV
jgi:hypothetical protein